MNQDRNVVNANYILPIFSCKKAIFRGRRKEPITAQSWAPNEAVLAVQYRQAGWILTLKCTSPSGRPSSATLLLCNKLQKLLQSVHASPSRDGCLKQEFGVDLRLLARYMIVHLHNEMLYLINCLTHRAGLYEVYHELV